MDNPLTPTKARNFFRAIHDEDSFTVLWELAENRPTPVPFESICKTFGADPNYLSEVLIRLLRLGVAIRAGRQWTATPWVKSSFEYLEEMMKTLRLDVAQPVSPGAEVFASNVVPVATHDGFWIAATSQVTALDRSGKAGPSAASAKAAVELNPLGQQDAAQNETRSHDYK